jgi:Mechanosensitive ion channel, conserved TM helix
MWSQINDALQQSFGRVLTFLANLLPGLVAMLLSVVLAALTGVLVRWLLVRLLSSIRFDERLERWGASAVAEWSPARSPTLLAGRLAYWMVVLLGAMVGLAALDATIMNSMLVRLGTYLPNVFVAVLLVVIGTVLARFLSRSVLISAVNMQIQSARLMSLGVKWLVLVLTAAMALDHLSIGGAILRLAFGILFGGIVLALALAVGLGSKEVVSRSWERQAERKADEAEVPLQHL